MITDAEKLKIAIDALQKIERYQKHLKMPISNQQAKVFMRETAENALNKIRGAKSE